MWQKVWNLLVIVIFFLSMRTKFSPTDNCPPRIMYPYEIHHTHDHLSYYSTLSMAPPFSFLLMLWQLCCLPPLCPRHAPPFLAKPLPKHVPTILLVSADTFICLFHLFIECNSFFTSPAPKIFVLGSFLHPSP